MLVLKLSGFFLYFIAVGYIFIGVLHSIYFQFFTSRSGIAATKGIVYWPEYKLICTPEKG